MITTIKQLNESLSLFWLTYCEQIAHHYPGIQKRILQTWLNEYLEYKSFNRSSRLLGQSEAIIYSAKLNLFFQEFIDAIKLGTPFAYLVGSSSFLGLNISINNSCLIPRQETELLVDYAFNSFFKNTHSAKSLTIADVGTGSGCILFALANMIYEKKKNTSPSFIHFIGLDLSVKCLEIAKINQYRLQSFMPIECDWRWLESDRLKQLIQEKTLVDLLLTNPPYIKKTQDLETVHTQVHSHEPHMALYLDDDSYLQWFKDFFVQISLVLKDGASMFMEGHEDHWDEVIQQIDQTIFYEITLLNDFTGRKRFLTMKRKAR